MMKRNIAVLLFFFTLNSVQAQDSIQLKQISWTSGFSYLSGVDFTFNIPISMEQQNIDSLWLFVSGYRITLSEKQLLTSNKNCTALFGWKTYYYHLDDTQFTCYGVERDDIVYEENDAFEPTVTFFLSHGKRKIVPVKFEEQIIAYP